MSTSPPRPVRASSRPLVGVVGILALLVALIAWGVSSPVGSSPDEDYHLASIWCGHGERDGLCEPGSSADKREVQQRLLAAASCYNFEPDVSAACQRDLFSEGTWLVDSDRGNFVGSYPPVFYFVLSFLASGQAVDAVLVMRAFNAFLTVLLLSVVWLASPARLRRGLVGGAAVTLVPLGMFVLPSVNPSSWAVLSAMTLPVAVLGYLTTEDRRRRWVLGGLAALTLGIGAGARADAALFGALAIGLAGIMTLRPGWAHVRRLVYPAVLTVVALFLYLSTGQAESVGSVEPPPLTVSGLAKLLGDIPDLWTGALGGWPLGWVDTHMPAVVVVTTWAVLAGAVFAALAGADRRQVVALAVGGAALWFVPTYMQHLTGLGVGAAIQPRYILPILVIIAVIALSRAPWRPTVEWSTSQWLLVCAALTLANAVALHSNLRRYVTGVDVTSVNLDKAAEWWWPGFPVGPNAVWALGTIAFGAALVLLTSDLRRPVVVDDEVVADATARTADPVPDGDAAGPQHTSGDDAARAQDAPDAPAVGTSSR